MLTEREKIKYSRQIILPNFGEKSQEKLKKAKVLIVGAGGLGSACSIYLTVAGVGNITLIDKDVVELSNLNRQILHYEEDIGKKKTFSAEQKLPKLNKDVKINFSDEEITQKNAEEIIKEFFLVIDCLDNFKTRFILNNACVKRKIPFIHAAVQGLIGQLISVIPGKSPCLRCLFPGRIKEIKPFPVLGATPGIFGCLQAIEAIKIITGLGKPLSECLLIFDGETMEFEKISVSRNKNCQICGNKRE